MSGLGSAIDELAGEELSSLSPAALRRALVVREGGCCFPGCDRPPSWADAHHIRHWIDGGATALANLVISAVAIIASCTRKGSPSRGSTATCAPPTVRRREGQRARSGDLLHSVNYRQAVAAEEGGGQSLADVVENVIQFPYKRSLGPVFGEFMTALTDRRILGIRCGDRVLAPPLEWNPETAETLEPNLIEVGPAGTVTLWTWVPEPSAQHPLQHPFGFALIQLDGADTPMFHAVDTGSSDTMHTGMRVAPRWKAERVGRIDDIECFVPGEQPVVPDGDAGPATEPVALMDYMVSITYHNPVSPSAQRVAEASLDGTLLGQRCPLCGRVYGGGRGYCPVDSVELTQADEVDLPQTGVVTNYTIVTPVQYPGQTETEPFVRAMVMLDGTDVILSYQPLLEISTDDVRVGLRVAAVWASPAERASIPRGGMGPSVGYLVGWMPTGAPDVADPDLVNRIF